MRSLLLQYPSSSGQQHGQGNWTFSQSILDALRGEPFVDCSDGKLISVANAAAYAKREARIFENETSAFVTTGSFDPTEKIARLNGPRRQEPAPVNVYYNGKWWKAKLVEVQGDKAKVHWVQLGYDTQDQDEWVDTNKIKRITE